MERETEILAALGGLRSDIGTLKNDVNNLWVEFGKLRERVELLAINNAVLKTKMAMWCIIGGSIPPALMVIGYLIKVNI